MSYLKDYNKIPIENIYYMLCYAWDRLKEKDKVEVEGLKCKNIYDLLSRVLYKGLSYLIKKGFYREYKLIYEETSSLRGKVNFNDSIKKNSFMNAKAYCEFDEFCHDIIHSQIIKATVFNLLRCKEIDKVNKDNLHRIYTYFNDVSNIRLNNKVFSMASVHRNNSFYGFLFDICKLIYDNMIVDEKSGKISFIDFEKDEKQMAYLFENFVRNFYKKELPEFKVYREDIRWNAVGDIEAIGYLPKMQTDITLEGKDRKIIIDTKYYKHAIKSNMGREKLNSNNLYQLFSYLKNIEHKGGKNADARGVLLYP